MEGEMRDGGRDGRVVEGGKTRHRDGSVVQKRYKEGGEKNVEKNCECCRCRD